MTMTEMEQPEVVEETKTITMQLKPKKSVAISEDTVDNENMDKRKSKSKS